MKQEIIYHVDKNDKVLGKMKRKDFVGSMKYTRSVNILLFDKNKLLLQKRAVNKEIEPNKYTASVTGFVKYRESYEEAAYRELKEELGIKVKLRTLFKKRTIYSDRKGISMTFIGELDKKIKINKREIESIKLFELNELFIGLSKFPKLFTSGLKSKLDVFKTLIFEDFFEKKVKFDLDKKKISGILCYPKLKDVKLPIVILSHGLLSHKNSSTYDSLAKILAKNGIPSFRFDYYARGESQGDFKDVTTSLDVKCLQSAIKYVKNLDFVDKERICLLGSSQGGITSLIATAKDSTIKCSVLYAPVSDWIERVEKEGIRGYSVEEWKEKGFIKIDEKKLNKNIKMGFNFYKDAKKNKSWDYASKIKSPTLIVQGTKDESIPIKHTRKLYNLLKCKKKLVILKGADHQFYPKKFRLERHKYALNWILEYL